MQPVSAEKVQVRGLSVPNPYHIHHSSVFVRQCLPVVPCKCKSLIRFHFWVDFNGIQMGVKLIDCSRKSIHESTHDSISRGSCLLSLVPFRNGILGKLLQMLFEALDLCSQETKLNSKLLDRGSQVIISFVKIVKAIRRGLRALVIFRHGKDG